MVSEKIKAAIAVTGLVSYLGWIVVDKYDQHKNNEIRQKVPEIQRVEKIPDELSTLVDELEQRRRNEDYRIEDIAEKYKTLATEYQTLTSREDITNARNQISTNQHTPLAIIFFMLGALCIGYTMFNASGWKEESEEPPQPAEATTA